MNWQTSHNLRPTREWYADVRSVEHWVGGYTLTGNFDWAFSGLSGYEKASVCIRQLADRSV